MAAALSPHATEPNTSSSFNNPAPPLFLSLQTQHCHTALLQPGCNTQCQASTPLSPPQAKPQHNNPPNTTYSSSTSTRAAGARRNSPHPPAHTAASYDAKTPHLSTHTRPPSHRQQSRSTNSSAVPPPSPPVGLCLRRGDNCCCRQLMLFTAGCCPAREGVVLCDRQPSTLTCRAAPSCKQHQLPGATTVNNASAAPSTRHK